MSKNNFRYLLFCLPFLFACLALIPTSLWLRNYLRLQPSENQAQIFAGIQYQRQVRNFPRSMVIHVVTVNLRQSGLSLLVTPGDPKAERPLKARSTSQFLEEFGLQLAVNGDGFTPWYSNNLLDYYPKAGDTVTPLGLAASKGVVYAPNTPEHPVLYFGRNNQARFNSSPGQVYNALSGNPMLVLQGKPAVGGKESLSDQGTYSPDDPIQPRTAIGLDKNNRRLIIVVIDGRQPGYSEGATLAETAEILVEFGVFNAMNLDGGGSSTLVKQGENGQAVLLNSPIDQQIPGRERVVGNHLGVYASAK